MTEPKSTGSSGLLPDAIPSEIANEIVENSRLNQILEEVSLATGATGAAIALVQGAQIVCRAATGPNAPDVGVCLDPSIGFSGSCIRTRQLQQCNDTETDPRVDLKNCRGLGVRSIVALPLIDGHELVGVFEILSSRPNAFAELDLRSLQALIHRILESRRQGGELTGTVPSEDPASDAVQPERAGRKTFPASRRLDSRHRHRDYWTGTLTASVIGLAVLLGWMMGRAGWNMAVDRAQQQIQAAPEEIQPGDTFPASSSAERPTGPAKPIHSTPALPAASKLAPKPKVEATEPVGGLVMSENGRVVFRMLPSERTSASEAAAGSIQTDVTGKSSPSASAQISNPNDK